MSANDAYFAMRATEADRLAGLSDDPRVRTAHEDFASAYRERLTNEIVAASDDGD